MNTKEGVQQNPRKSGQHVAETTLSTNGCDERLDVENKVMLSGQFA